MKQSPELAAVQRQMGPGVITQEGFLGTDRRTLGEILETDDAAVKRLGLTHEDIAWRMRELRAAGASGLGVAVAVGPHFEVTVESVRGKLPCPFGHRGLHEKTSTAVCNTRLGEQVVFSDLSIHLIEAHGFYEGCGAFFRLDPAVLVRVIEPVSGA